MHWLDANEIFWMTFYTVDRIMESGNSDALALYIKYLKQSRIQSTNKTFSLDEFMWKWMWWWHNRFYKAKKILKDLCLIDVIKTMWPDGKFVDNFVRVNYLIDENRIRNAGTTYELIHSPQNAESGIQGEEMLNNININNNTWNSLLNSESRAGELDACVPVESYEDIQQVIDNDEYRINNNKLLKCIVKMALLWYNVQKNEKTIKELVDWIKEKADIYWIKNSDWSVAQWTMLQIFDQWYEYWISKGTKVGNHKNSVARFMINYNKFNNKLKK